MSALAPLAAALLLCACSGQQVRVQDPAGRPIEGARVVGVTASLDTAPVFTDADGEVRVPWTPEDLWWVKAWGDGYCPSPELDVRGKPRPFTVVLQPRSSGACPNLERPGLDGSR
jgi:hypothetical protein